MKKHWPIAVAGACLALAAGAQTTIYRCGSSYSEDPCPGAVAVATQRAPSAEQAAASRRETEREMKLATAMEAARLKEEAKPIAVYIPKEAAVHKDEPRKPEVFTAKLAGDPKKKAPKKPAKKPAKKA